MLHRVFILFPTQIGKWYETSFHRNPFITSGLTMGSKASFCDAAAQYLADPKCELDYLRMAKFTIFCVGYAGCFQHYVFNVLYARLFPGNSMFVAVQKTLTDNLVHSPFVYLPSYYIYKSLACNDSMTSGLIEYRSSGFQVFKACCWLWIPAQFICFSFIPMHFRILFNAFVGTIWEVILSYRAPMEAVPRKG